MQSNDTRDELTSMSCLKTYVGKSPGFSPFCTLVTTALSPNRKTCRSLPLPVTSPSQMRKSSCETGLGITADQSMQSNRADSQLETSS